MDQTEVKKTCYACGVDVTHASRYKNRDGEYLCAQCMRAKREWAQSASGQHTARKSRRYILGAMLAAGGTWAFYKLLKIMCQWGEYDSSSSQDKLDT
jgi:hypothetical protein